MKNIFKFIVLGFVSLMFWACAEDPLFDNKLERSDFFVSFRTFNGLIPSATMLEGDTVIIEVSIGATRGKAITVDLEVQLPEVANEVSKAYELLDMNDNPMTDFKLTFPDGTGSQRFKFVATDNDIIDGTRIFTLAITGNSAGYNIGVGTMKENATYNVIVRDDDVPLTIEDLLGTWTVTEEQFLGGWEEVEYDVTFERIDDTTVKIIGFGGKEDVELIATLDLVSKTNSITIPFQKLDVAWAEGFDFYFTFNEAVSGGWGTGFNALTIEREDDGTLHFSLGNSYTWEFAVTHEGKIEWFDYYVVAYATEFVKTP